MQVLRNHWQLIVLFTLVMVLWNGPQMVPLKLLVVFFHEFSHALMTWGTGGSVVDFTVSANISGEVLSRGGSRFLILQAGYLGSLAIGAFLFVLAVRTDLDRWITGVMGVLMVMIALLYVSADFSTFFALGTGAALIALAWFAPVRVNDLILRIIGLASMVSVPRSLWNHTIQFPELQSDAHMLSDEYGLPVLIWGVIWLAISAAIIFASLYKGLRGNSNLIIR